ncbi:MAG: hypothetical protein J7500_01045 [Sphingomonas sp.]|uniref:hypothetical protein n=1 Tax=Sphingomonas sp. TaxID=28214 RepID=UPI001B1AFB74|nr:hypothetical protein [Sphingomonas sp.]MBO9621274.1 hypothetical protein [Sphingomonas sp.]
MSVEPQLSRTEWQAVSVALHDAADCGCAIPPRAGSLRDRAGRVLRAVFGGSPKTALADPRLEALRRFVCTARVTHGPASDEAEALAAHGFSRAQIDAIALISA